MNRPKMKFGRNRVCVLMASLTFSMAAIAAAPEAKHGSFASPEEATSALIVAAKSGDTKALLGILGPEAKAVLESGDAVADRAGRERFVKSFEEANKLAKSGESKAILIVGKDGWAFPIPIVKAAAGWRFDTAAGKEEILNRRVGRNELSAMQAVLAYVDAQREYYLRNPQSDKLLQYAQKLVSAEGKRDGLYWPAKAGERPSPLGPAFMRAKAEGYAKGEGDKLVPYHGYHYRILRTQGPDAPGGAYDYVVRGNMIGGFALVAYPAAYGNSGVMTFIVNHDGMIYQKDLGPGTAATAQKMTKFNPDKTWKRAENP